MGSLYIGLMSGTSLDGVDGVLVDLAPADGTALCVRAHAHRAFAPALADELLALNAATDNELQRAALAANALAELYRQIVEALLTSSAVPRDAIRAVGAHGQTVRHRPGEFDGVGYTLQLNNPALLAERCCIDVVADFRSRDVAAGGQGAPLVPAFHRAVFGHTGAALAVLNLGGIANLTVLAADGSTLGFDCGPANALMDHWCHLHTGQAYDAGGAWAASGSVVEPLLATLLAEPYFALPAPKSTGRDLFNPRWLEARLNAGAGPWKAEDVQATLAELTLRTVADALRRVGPASTELLVCGGGALNAHLMQGLAHHLPALRVRATDALGLPAQQVEACAFAWLAQACLERRPGNLASVTGARGPRVLGAIYPA